MSVAFPGLRVIKLEFIQAMLFQVKRPLCGIGKHVEPYQTPQHAVSVQGLLCIYLQYARLKFDKNDPPNNPKFQIELSNSWCWKTHSAKWAKGQLILFYEFGCLCVNIAYRLIFKR